MTDEQKAKFRKILEKAEALISEADETQEPDLEEDTQALWEKAQGRGRYSGLKPVESLEERARLHMEEVAKREYETNKWIAAFSELVKTND